MNTIYTKEWQDFKVGELFHIVPAKGKNSTMLDDGDDVAYIAASKENNGFNRMVSVEGLEDWVSRGNCLQLIHIGDAAAGWCNYVHDDFIGMKGKSSCAYNQNMNEYSGLFIASVIQCVNAGKYSFKEPWTGKRMTETVIALPAALDGEPDWDYMESYMKAVMDRQAQVIDSLSRIAKDKHPISMKLWSGFLIKDLFHKLDLKCRKADFSKSKDCSEIRDDEFCLPLVNAKHYDNGIQYYGRFEDWDSAEMTIDIVSNGAVATGDVYAQPQRTGVLWDAYLIKPNHEEPSEYALHFLACVIQKCVKQFFSYDNKCTWDKVKEKRIMLPVADDGKPDWGYMETYMQSVMERQAHIIDYLTKIKARA